MAKFPEAQARLFHNVFVCKKCKKKARTSMQKIIQRKIVCKRCGSKNFRAIKKAKASAGAAT
ncbi:50S ribosomal protein L40e [Candidatus Woesearchaeota archaeon]|nr:50S ribosomal protein L40e [Candidatus Woesearchaeota archaeon]